MSSSVCLDPDDPDHRVFVGSKSAPRASRIDLYFSLVIENGFDNVDAGSLEAFDVASFVDERGIIFPISGLLLWALRSLSSSTCNDDRRLGIWGATLLESTSKPILPSSVAVLLGNDEDLKGAVLGDTLPADRSDKCDGSA